MLSRIMYGFTLRINRIFYFLSSHEYPTKRRFYFQNDWCPMDILFMYPMDTIHQCIRFPYPVISTQRHDAIVWLPCVLLFIQYVIY